MASYADTVRYALLNYPTLYSGPLDVCIHMFLHNGNGYDWVDGELSCDRSYDEKNSMTEMDMDVDAWRRNPDGTIMECFIEMDSMATIERDSEIMKREFIFKHLDELCKPENCTYNAFGEKRSSIRPGYHTTHGITSKRYMVGLNFPDDIKPDWAEALAKFLSHWAYSIRSAVNNWVLKKEEANVVLALIECEEKRLLGIRTGRDPDEVIAEREAFAKKVIDEIIEEEKLTKQSS